MSTQTQTLPETSADAGPPPARRPAIDALTSLRGLAALWVVLYHFANDLLALLPGTRALAPFLHQGHFAVPIFFILSGYVLTYNYLDALGPRPTRAALSKFWARRLLRIYPLHLATLLAVLAMVVASRRLGLRISGTGYGARDFVLNLLLVHTWVPHFELNWNYPSWSISSEWFAYLMFPLACLGFVRVRRPATLLGLAVLTYAATLGFYLAGDLLPFRELIAVVGPFLLGCTLARMTGLGLVPNRPARGVAWFAAIALVLVPFLVPAHLMIVGLLTAGASLIFLLGAAGEGCSRFWLWKPLIVLGDVSYSLYMVHTLAQKILDHVAPSARFAHSSLPVRLGVVALYAAVIALATWLAHRWIDTLFRHALRRRLSL